MCTADKEVAGHMIAAPLNLGVALNYSLVERFVVGVFVFVLLRGYRVVVLLKGAWPQGVGQRGVELKEVELRGEAGERRQ